MIFKLKSYFCNSNSMVMQNMKVYGYTLLHQLGVGGMAEVWYAENEIGKKAAVKILLPRFCADEAIVARFQNEAKVMVKLDHPNIRQAYDYTTIDGRPCMVMEYLEGDDLSSRMKHGERFTDEQLKKWWNQITDALNYTHAEGVVHRDLKPSNIFVDKKGNVKLLDFGIAKIKESISMTQTGSMMGTLMYMSPEQVMDTKHIDAATDRYSLAVTFVHLLTGKAPYDTTTTNDFEIRENIVRHELDLKSIPADWQKLLQPYLSKDPKERPALTGFSASNKGATVQPTMPVHNTVDAEETFVGSANTSMPDEGTVVETPQEPVQQKETPEKAVSPTPKKKIGLIIGIAVGAGALLLTGLVVLLVVLLGDGGNKGDSGDDILGMDTTEVATEDGDNWEDQGITKSITIEKNNSSATESNPTDNGQPAKDDAKNKYTGSPAYIEMMTLFDKYAAKVAKCNTCKQLEDCDTRFDDDFGKLSEKYTTTDFSEAELREYMKRYGKIIEISRQRSNDLGCGW